MKKSMKNTIVTAALASALLLTSVNALAFTDVPADHWAANDIAKLTNSGYINGYEDGSFAPSNFITRAEFVTIINKVKGVSATSGKLFTDVSRDAWYANEIDKAVTAGFITGYDDGTVRPDACISRAEVAVVCYKAWNLVPEGKLGFVDSNSIGSWAQQQVATLVSKNIISGYEDGTFRPDDAITRAEVAKIVSRLISMKDNVGIATTVTTNKTPAAGLSNTSVVVKGGSSSGGGSSSSSSSSPSKAQQSALEDIADGDFDLTTLKTVIKYSNNSASVKEDYEDLYKDALDELLKEVDYDDYKWSKKADAKDFADDVSAVVLSVNEFAEGVIDLAKKSKLDEDNLLAIHDNLKTTIKKKATEDNRDNIYDAMYSFCKNFYKKTSDMFDLANGEKLNSSDIMAMYDGTYDGTHTEKEYEEPSSKQESALENIANIVNSSEGETVTISVSDIEKITEFAQTNNDSKDYENVKADSDLNNMYAEALTMLVKNIEYTSVSDMNAKEATEFAMDITAVVETVNTSVTIVKNLAVNGNLDKEHLIGMKDSILSSAELYVSKTNAEAVESTATSLAMKLYEQFNDKFEKLNGKDLTKDDIIKIYNGNYEFEEETEEVVEEVAE